MQVMFINMHNIYIYIYTYTFKPKYRNWYSGEPNGGSSSNCVTMWPLTYVGFWNDEPCTSSYGYLCSKCGVDGSCIQVNSVVCACMNE
jgi:hypothetical protein